MPSVSSSIDAFLGRLLAEVGAVVDLEARKFATARASERLASSDGGEPGREPVGVLDAIAEPDQLEPDGLHDIGRGGVVEPMAARDPPQQP